MIRTFKLSRSVAGYAEAGFVFPFYYPSSFLRDTDMAKA